MPRKKQPARRRDPSTGRFTPTSSAASSGMASTMASTMTSTIASTMSEGDSSNLNAPPKVQSMEKKKKKKFRPGTVSLRNIRRLQQSTSLLVSKKPIERVIREILNENGGEDYRISGHAVEALHQAVEAHMVELYEATNLCAIHAQRVTIMQKDLLLAKQLGKRW